MNNIFREETIKVNGECVWVEEIEAELLLCAKSRLVCGKENTFFEKLFKAYSHGMWPCGWNNGKIIVYVSSNIK